MRFAKDGVPVIIAALFFALILIAIGWLLNNSASIPLYLVGLFLAGFTLFFFRDPERNVPEGPYILAPADGKVISINPVRQDSYVGGPCRQISIFLSIVDVHVNRYPVSGKVEYVSYHPGKYLVAWHPKSSSHNERTTVVVETPAKQQVLFRQIAGAVARRIVCYSKEGEFVNQGHEMGFIKFGSRVDVFMPLDAQIDVNLGDKVTGGRTVLASFK